MDKIVRLVDSDTLKNAIVSRTGICAQCFEWVRPEDMGISDRDMPCPWCNECKVSTAEYAFRSGLLIQVK